jgi:hypothetical protein
MKNLAYGFLFITGISSLAVSTSGFIACAFLCANTESIPILIGLAIYAIISLVGVRIIGKSTYNPNNPNDR